MNEWVRAATADSRRCNSCKELTKCYRCCPTGYSHLLWTCVCTPQTKMTMWQRLRVERCNWTYAILVKSFRHALVVSYCGKCCVLHRELPSGLLHTVSTSQFWLRLSLYILTMQYSARLHSLANAMILSSPQVLNRHALTASTCNWFSQTTGSKIRFGFNCNNCSYLVILQTNLARFTGHLHTVSASCRWRQ